MIKKIIILTLLLNAYIMQAQVIFSDNFNDGDLNGWTNIDNDDDPTFEFFDYNLWLASNSYAQIVVGGDSYAAMSASKGYDYSTAVWSDLHPNNFLISPEIDLTGASSSNLKLKFASGSGSYPDQDYAEHYAVYITNTNTIADIEAATPVFEETLASGEEMFSHIVVILSYAGQTVYITFRHFNCTAQLCLLIDDVEVEQVFNDNADIEILTLNRYSMVNTDNTLGINITNNGANNITSVTVDWNDGTSHSSTITGLDIAPSVSVSVNHPTSINYASVLEKEITVTITDVNGASNSETSLNTKLVNFNTISQTSVKKVLFEEATGTWCPGCPGGTVMMDNMTSSYPVNLIGIAVHVREDDPMNIPEYETGAVFFAAPTLNVDRKLLSQDIFDAENLYNQQISLDIPVELSATISGTGNSLTIEASAIFRTAFANANFRLGVIIVEDHVTGTTSAYNQANVYAGGAYGDMGDFDELPDPVPADQMEYNHVGRALLGGYSGQENSVPTNITDGQEVTYSFNYTIPSTSNIDNMHAVVVLIDQSNGEIVNAETALLQVGIESINIIETSVYPNPTSDILNIEFIGEAKEYLITLFDVDGKTVLQKKENTSIGNTQVILSTKDLQKGIYFMNISTKGKSTTKKIIVN